MLSLQKKCLSIYTVFIRREREMSMLELFGNYVTIMYEYKILFTLKTAVREFLWENYVKEFYLLWELGQSVLRNSNLIPKSKGLLSLY